MPFPALRLRSPAFEKLMAEPGLAGLGPEPRRARLPLDELSVIVASLFAREHVSDSRQPLVRAAILLWHDHLDASHQISQGLYGKDGSFLHGIMHRREPDYSNAKYWFHRVGAHPSFPIILKQVQALEAESGGPGFAETSKSWSQWDPFAYVDACEQAASLPARNPEVQALERVQEIEIRTLLNLFLSSG